MNTETMNNGTPEEFTAASIAELHQLTPKSDTEEIVIITYISGLMEARPATAATLLEVAADFDMIAELQTLTLKR